MKNAHHITCTASGLQTNSQAFQFWYRKPAGNPGRLAFSLTHAGLHTRAKSDTCFSGLGLEKKAEACVFGWQRVSVSGELRYCLHVNGLTESRSSLASDSI